MGTTVQRGSRRRAGRLPTPRLTLTLLAGVTLVAVFGCQQPTPPAPTAASSTAAVAASSPVASAPAPVAAIPGSPVASPGVASPSPSPSPVAAAAPPRPELVISWSHTSRVGQESFRFEGTRFSDGSGMMTEPAGRMGFPPSREMAAQLNALADRLASFTITPDSPGGCSLGFKGRGTAVATEEDKKAVRALVGC